MRHGGILYFRRKAMTIDRALSIISVLFGIIGLVIAAYEIVRRRKLSAMVESHLKVYPGDVAKIHESCHNAWVSTKAALAAVAKLQHSGEQELAINLTGSTIGDTRAGKDMSINLFGHLLAFQEGQFGTR